MFAEDVVAFAYVSDPWKKLKDAGGMGVYRNGKRSYVGKYNIRREQLDVILQVGDAVGLDICPIGRLADVSFSSVKSSCYLAFTLHSKRSSKSTPQNQRDF